MKVTKVPKEVTSVNALFYGAPGVGKTTLASTFPKPLFLDFESGVSALAGKDIDIARAKSWEDFGELISFLDKNENGYETIVIDTITEAQRMLMDTILRKFTSVKRAYGEALPTMSDWGANIQYLRSFVRVLRDLPMHTVFTAHLQLTEANESKIFEPMLSGKLSSEIAGYVDIVGYYYIDGEDGKASKRKMVFEPLPKLRAKDRFGKLPNVMENPTYEKIIAAIKNKSKGGKS